MYTNSPAQVVEEDGDEAGVLVVDVAFAVCSTTVVSTDVAVVTDLDVVLVERFLTDEAFCGSVVSRLFLSGERDHGLDAIIERLHLYCKSLQVHHQVMGCILTSVLVRTLKVWEQTARDDIHPHAHGFVFLVGPCGGDVGIGLCSSQWAMDGTQDGLEVGVHHHREL